MTQRLTLREARNRFNAIAKKHGRPTLRQEDLAKKIGVDQTYISLLEAGKRVPSDDVKRRLAKALGIAPSRLRFSEPQPDSENVAGERDRTGHDDLAPELAR